MTAWQALLRAASLARPVSGRLAGSVALAVVSIGAGIALLGASGYLVSRAAELPPVLSLAVAIAAVRAFALVRAVSRYLERLASHDAALRVLVEARVRFLARLIRRLPAGLPAGGDVLSRAVADVESLQHLFVRALSPPVVAAMVASGAGVAAWLMLPAAGAVLLTALAVAGAGVPLLSVALTARANRRQAGARAALAAELAEAGTGARELVALGLGPAHERRLVAADETLTRLVLRDALGSALAVAAGTAAAWAAAVALLVVAVPAVAAGALDGVLLAALVLMGIASFEAVNGLPAAAQGMTYAAAAARRLEEVAAEPDAEAAPAPGVRPAPSGPLRLEVRGLTARPAAGAPAAVRGASFALRPGERVALVGPSGCGKSTLLRALVGLASVDAGEISVDGEDVKRLDPAALRDRIRLLDQEAHLFATTIAENVRLARPGATDAEVREALERVGLGPWLDSLPDGLRTYLGDDGARCSGGQRQRIALARGLLSGADLLLVDEPTSHLDPAAAEAFLHVLLTTPGGAGVLVTTHRPSELGRFDRVLVMRRGRVVERKPQSVAAGMGAAGSG